MTAKVTENELSHLIDLVRAGIGDPKASMASRRVAEQLDLLNPPAQAHSRTSRAAAEQIKDHAPSLRERVYAFIAKCGPVTDEQIAVTLGLNPSTARPRRIELVAEGLVRAHHETVRTSSGREANAWVAT